MFKLDNRITLLQKELEGGRIDEFQFARGLKSFYDRSPTSFDTRSLRFMETKINEAGLPLTEGRQGRSDGVLAQTVSGLIEGFTTFGFADTPDTSTERIANNIGHLIGLAPSLVVSTITGGRAAAGVVSRGLKEKAKKSGNKRLEKVAERIELKSQDWQNSNLKIQKAMDRFARATKLASPTPTGIDPATGKKLYGVVSIPGLAANFIQKQATKGLHNNNVRILEYMNKGILKSKYIDKAAVENIVNQSIHLSLLMAMSAQPYGTRGEGFKGMAMAGVHGAVAGSIFGTIGEYVSIGRMLGSSNAVVRGSGERVVRGFAKALGTQPNRIDQYNTINFIMRGGAGVSYGTVTSELNDLPLEDQIYETLMAAFFSVNSRASFENRATRDIYNSMNAIPRDYNMKKARNWLTEQPWYQNETPEYQAYWSRYLKNIQQQQIDYTVNQYNDIILAYAETYKELKEKGIITPEMEQKAKTDRKAKEKILGEMYDALDKQKAEIEESVIAYRTEKQIGDTEQVAKDIEKKKFRLDSITLEDGRTIEYQVQEVDPLSEHLPKQKSLKNIFIDVKRRNKDASVQDLHNMFKKTIDDVNYDINAFVKEVSGKYRITVSDKQKRELIQTAHYLKEIDRFPIARIYIVGEGALSKDKKMQPTLEKEAPETDSYDKPIGGSKAGNPTHGSSRVNKNNNFSTKEGDTLHYDYEYLTARILERYWDYASNSYKNRPRVKNVAPLSVDIFRYIPEGKTDSKGKRIRPLQLAEHMTDKQLNNMAKQLEKEGAFIYAANGETGRIQVRAYPWRTGTKLKDIKALNNFLINELKIPVTKARYKSNIATLMWRMQETGLIRLGEMPTKDLIREWVKTEPYESVTKFQKRTKHHSGIEIALNPEYFAGYKNLTRTRQVDMDVFNPKNFTDIKLSLDPLVIERFLNDKRYTDIDMTPIFENTYITLYGKRSSKANNDLYEQFAKDNPELIQRVEAHNKKVLESIESGTYRLQDKFNDIGFSKLKDIPEYEPLSQISMSRFSRFEGDTFNHIIIKDLPSSVKDMGKALKENNSGTDGVTMTHQKLSEIIKENYGYDPRTGVFKTLGLFRPEYNVRGQIINKTADFEMDSYWQAFAEKHNLDKIHYVSGIKEMTGVEPTKVRWNEKTKEFELVGKLNVFKSKIEDNYLNLNVYENFEKIGNQKLLQQVMSNINTFEMDPNTKVGRDYWNKWEELVSKAAAGDPKATALAEKEYLGNKELSGKIDDISIKLLDQILFERPDSKAAQSIIKQILEIERLSDFDKQAMQEWTDYRTNTYNRQLVEDYLIDTNFDPGTYLRPGVREYINERIKQYVAKRLTRPRIRHSYSSKLGLYDVLISGRKQKYSKAKKGLANNEFMMNEGARDVIEVTVYEGKKNEKTMTLGKFWDTWVEMKENPTTKRAQRDFEEYDFIRKNVAFIRSPMISNGGFRIGEFIGFAKTRKGISLITNEYNDFMMSGADKDIDSAHMFWGLPKELTTAYKQSFIQDQLVRKKNGKKDTVDLKDPERGRELANAEPSESKGKKEHLADILDTRAKLRNGKISTMSQDSIGLITNGVNQISLELDINRQLEDNTPRTDAKIKSKMRDNYLNAFNELIIDRNVMLNTYIDAADLSNIDLPIVALRKMRARYEWMYEGAETGEMEARRQAIKNMHKLVFGSRRKTDMPLDVQETATHYLEKTQDAKSYLGLIADQYIGLRLELNPWNRFSKEQSVALLKDISEQIINHPIYRKVGIKDFSEHFMKGLNPKEFDNIVEYETFLWNKLNQVIDLSSALKKSNDFKQYAMKELEMTSESVDDFITQVVELTFEQRNRLYQSFTNDQKYFKKHNRRSYGDQIAYTKIILREQLEQLSNRRKEEGKPLPEEAFNRVEDLFDVFYIATPLIKSDFVGFRGENRFEFLRRVNSRINELLKEKEQKEKLGEFFNKSNRLEGLYALRGSLQAEFTGQLPDREQTWAIRARNKEYMSKARYETLKLSQESRQQRIDKLRQELELDKFEEVIMDDLNVPPKGRQSKIDAKPGQEVVLKTKKMVPDLIDLDVLTDPAKLDALIDSLQPLKKSQTPLLKENLNEFKNLIYSQTAVGNEKLLFNLPSEYSFFLKRIDRTSDFIQNIDGTRFGFFMKMMNNKYGKEDVLTKIKRNKELLQEAENALKADITRDIPLDTFDEFYKKRAKENTKEEFMNISQQYKVYVDSWAKGNSKLVNEVADKTEAKILKDSDTIIYGYNEKTQKIQKYKSRESFEKKNNKYPYIQELEPFRLSELITNEINALNPSRAHLRDPKKLDQVLGIYQRLNKELAPFEQRLQFDRVLKFNEKTGQMEEYGITVPTSTLKTVAETIYRLHVNANQLSDFNTKYVGLVKKVLNESQKGYKDHGNALWEYAAVKHTLGEDNLGPKKGQTTAEEQVDLIKRLEKAESDIKKINQKFYYTNSKGDRVYVEPLEYADIIRTEVIQPIMEYSLNSMIKSNYKNIGKLFEQQTTFPLEFFSNTTLPEGHPKYWQQRMAQLFLNKHGLIEVRRLLWFDKTVRLQADKQTGFDVQKNHFHYDDIVWIKFHLNLRDHILDKYSDYVNNNGSLDWNALGRTKIKEGKKTISMADKVRRDIRAFSGKYGEWSSEVGKFAEDGVSDRFFPQMGQMDTKLNRKFIQEVWLPTEKERIMAKTNYKQLTDSKLAEDVRDRLITFKEAKELEYQRLENKVLEQNKYENPYIDPEAMDMLNQISTRKGKNPYPGMGTTTHARSRLERSMPGWRSDGNVPLDYMNSLSRGLMQNIGAMYSRIYLDKFLTQSKQNPRMRENAKKWHATMIDFTRGYMGFPSTRVLEVHGVTAKEMQLLKDWQKANFDQGWKVGKLDVVSKKLLYDLEQQSIPTTSEQRMKKRELIVRAYKSTNGNKLNALRKELKTVKSEQRKEEIIVEMANLKQKMYENVKKQFAKYLETQTIKNLNEFIKDENIDKLNINNTPRQWFSDESVGNLGLKLENRISKVYGGITGKKLFPSLPDNVQARHKALVDRAQYISDLEGRFELLSLLFSPKAAITNVYGGYQNIITDTGFDHFFKSGDTNYLIKEIFAGQKFKLFNKQTGKFEFRELRNKEDIHEMIDSLGLLEGNLLQELAYIQANEPVQAKKFLKELVKKVTAHTRAEKLYGNTKEVNDKINKYVNTTVGELAKKYNVNKAVMDKGSIFMSATEKHLRRKAFLAHYLKAREIYSDLEGNVRVTDEFLVDSARKGVEASQFIYHATFRPNFSNTAFGRVMTRFQPYAWNSIRRRKVIFEDMMAAEGHPNFEVTKRFQRQVANDMMTMALGTLFAYSIFEYALSPPMSWMKESAEFLFGDEETRKKAFFNQYPIQALAPLQIITPPASRFILPHINGMVNGDYEAFWKYTAWTYVPGGRFARDVYKTVNNPKYAVEYQTGLPYNSFKWHMAKVRRQAEQREINEDPTT